MNYPYSLGKRLKMMIKIVSSEWLHIEQLKEVDLIWNKTKKWNET